MQKVDLFWLVDASGSMTDTINNIRVSISRSWDFTADDFNLAQGIGFYRDVNVDPDGYKVLQPITTNPNLLQTAADQIQPVGGGDSPESQVYALTQIGLRTSEIRWRENSHRIVLWLGDYYGHNNQAVNGITYTTRGAVNALQSNEITVFAFSMDPVNKLNESNGGEYVAASQIAHPTGGEVFSSVNQQSAVDYILGVILFELQKVNSNTGIHRKLSSLVQIEN